ncbi:hypothetical protein Dimus_014295 [Dionaea muscipula]
MVNSLRLAGAMTGHCDLLVAASTVKQPRSSSPMENKTRAAMYGRGWRQATMGVLAALDVRPWILLGAAPMPSLDILCSGTTTFKEMRPVSVTGLGNLAGLSDRPWSGLQPCMARPAMQPRDGWRGRAAKPRQEAARSSATGHGGYG